MALLMNNESNESTIRSTDEGQPAITIQRGIIGERLTLLRFSITNFGWQMCTQSLHESFGLDCGHRSMGEYDGVAEESNGNGVNNDVQATRHGNKNGSSLRKKMFSKKKSF